MKFKSGVSGGITNSLGKFHHHAGRQRHPPKRIHENLQVVANGTHVVVQGVLYLVVFMGNDSSM